MKNILATVSTLVVLMVSNASFAGEVGGSELSPTDPRVIKICSCNQTGLDANCQPLQGDRGQGDTQGGRH